MGRSLAASRPALGGFSGQEMPSGVSACPSMEEQTTNCHKRSPRELEMLEFTLVEGSLTHERSCESDSYGDSFCGFVLVRES